MYRATVNYKHGLYFKNPKYLCLNIVEEDELDSPKYV